MIICWKRLENISLLFLFNPAGQILDVLIQSHCLSLLTYVKKFLSKLEGPLQSIRVFVDRSGFCWHQGFYWYQGFCWHQDFCWHFFSALKNPDGQYIRKILRIFQLLFDYLADIQILKKNTLFGEQFSWEPIFRPKWDLNFHLKDF